MANDFELLIENYLAQVQELNDVATQTLADVSLAGATGVQLDGLGQLIGLGREGLSDDLYRPLLRAWIRVNRSRGTIEDLNEIVRLASDTTAAEQAFALMNDPAHIKIEFFPILPAGVGPLIADAIHEGKAAGVYPIFEYHETEPEFAFDGANGGSKFDGGWFLQAAIRNREARESDTA